MYAKTIEVRDAATFIPALAVRLSSDGFEEDRYLLGRAGFGTTTEAQSQYVLFTRLTDGETHYDPQQWPNRTMQVAHQHVVEHFDALAHGAVVDVQHILGETPGPKPSEREANLGFYLQDPNRADS